jgi:hypothetical protein
MISTYLDKIRANEYTPEKSVVNTLFYICYNAAKKKYPSFIIKLTNRTQHRGAKPFRR